MNNNTRPGVEALPVVRPTPGAPLPVPTPGLSNTSGTSTQ
jgi:hypothetical protein